MPTRVPAVTLCLSVSLTFCGKVPAWRLFSTSPTLFYRNSGIYKDNGTSVWNFVATNSELKIIRYGVSKRVINLARESGRSERDKLERHRSTKLTIPPSSDARPRL